jgi:hypothetical protein
MLPRGILERGLRLSNDTVPEYRNRLTLEELLLDVKTGTILQGVCACLLPTALYPTT